ncbi:serine protease inhibitor 28Dc-like isoform X2 [Ochlerotatus camptorhynchus]|uniref:serine protease inhibitor 28Dc-like isoform X2 n=1 Tax=Ochlerotatus camptorhynchus TaxID=644619 RepID=UPI0031E3CD13
MRLFASIGIILLVVVLQSHCQQDQDLTIGPTRQNLDLVSRSVTNLAQKISLAIASPKSKTELFSPVSIAGALSLLLLGSGGTTRDELTNLLGFQGQPISFTDIHKSFGRLFEELVSNEPSMMTRIPWRENDKCNNPDEDEEDEPSYQPSKAPSNQENRNKRDADNASPFDSYSHEIQLANGLFLENSYNLNPQYAKYAKEWYKSGVERLDFSKQPIEATQRINSWVNENTHGKIPEIFSAPLGSNTVMVIASALYFKALWQDMFIEGATKPRDFYPNGRNHSAIKVDMMAHGGCFPYYESPEMNVRILGVPYKNNQTTMYIIKPHNSNREVLQDFIAQLRPEELSELIDKMRQTTAVVLFPKMHVSSTLNLKKTLKHLGVRSIFSAPKSDLSGLLGKTKSPEIQSPAPVAPSQVNRPAVNLLDYNRIKPKPVDHTHKLVFSRLDANESNNETTLHATTDNPTTLEETADTDPTIESSSPSATAKPTIVSPRRKRDVSYKAPSEVKSKPDPLNSKDFFLNKRIVKTTPGKKSHRTRRDAQNLYVSDAIHKIDLEINESGTEGGAATAITLNRSGTNAVMRADEPFLLLIRNDRTKLPLFFGAVYDPSN